MNKVLFIILFAWSIIGHAAQIETKFIADDAVTNAKLANIGVNTVLGRVTAGTGNPENLTTTQLTTLINSFTSGLSGAAPASGGGTTNFLRADGTWAPPGGGANTTLSNLTNTIAIPNAVHLQPLSGWSVNLGSTTLPFNFVNAQAYTAIHTTGAQAGQVSASTATPSGLGAGAGAGVSLIGLSGGKWAGVFTINRTGGTEPTYVETGNSTTAGNTGLINIQSGAATSGNSGNINLRTGTATGTRGNVTLNGSHTVNTNGFKAQSVTGDPCGATATYPEGSLFYNDTSDYFCFCNGAGADVQMHNPATDCF